MRNNTRPCYVTYSDGASTKAFFHRWVDFQTVLAPSLLNDGRPGGQVSQTFALVEFESGAVVQVEPERIVFDIGPEWCDSKIELPSDPEELVLCIAHGTVEENCFLAGAYELAFYDPNDGWILEQYPEAKDITVTHWMPLPPPPRGTAHE